MHFFYDKNDSIFWQMAQCFERLLFLSWQRKVHFQNMTQCSYFNSPTDSIVICLNSIVLVLMCQSHFWELINPVPCLVLQWLNLGMLHSRHLYYQYKFPGRVVGRGGMILIVLHEASDDYRPNKKFIAICPPAWNHMVEKNLELGSYAVSGYA